MKKLGVRFDELFESLIDCRIEVDLASGEDKKGGKASKDFLQFLLEREEQGNDKSSLSMNQIRALFMCLLFYSYWCFFPLGPTYQLGDKEWDIVEIQI